METAQFCGQSCHVMTPEFTSHEDAPHAQVTCVECHVAPGVGRLAARARWRARASWWRSCSTATSGRYPPPWRRTAWCRRRQTCEQCHWRDKPGGARLRVIPKFAEDEANTQTPDGADHAGGGANRGRHPREPHGSGHRDPIRDERRQAAGHPVGRVQERPEGRVAHLPRGKAKAEEVAALPKYTMQCVDCHNRATHAFDSPEQGGTDKALAAGQLSASLPYIKKKSVEVLKASYASSEEAGRERSRPPSTTTTSRRIPTSTGSERPTSRAPGRAVAAIYARNVFPDLKVTWGTYPDNIGHEAFPGLLPLPRRGPRDPGGQDHHAGLRGVPRSGRHGRNVARRS